ncbi:hypothetical protein [Streptomyces sp. NPDC047525]|uniref:hypothetical protein n=1 Tax=Streptomyces sp. NPDC047525 TaxID=3155264 RepID=UPI0033E35ACC
MPRTKTTPALPMPDLVSSLVITGAVRQVEAHPDGSWTITPATGRPVRLTSQADAVEYAQQAATGAPRETDTEETAGCGCVPAAPVAMPAARAAALQQARAIADALGPLGIPTAQRSAVYDEQARRPAVRVAATHGLYALHIPPMGQPLTVTRDGRRNGALGARRVPAVSDDHLALLFLAYLRDRGELN